MNLDIIISELYAAQNRTVADLAYTVTFDELCNHFREKTGKDWTKRAVWKLLNAVHKAGKLPRKTERKVKTTKKTQEKTRAGGFFEGK